MIKRRNNKIIPYENGDRLPAWRFFKIIETGDFRYLLRVKELPRYYNTDNLLHLYDQILIKIDKITGREEFKDSLEGTKDSILEKNKMIALEAAFSLMKYNDKYSISTLKYYGINVPDCSLKSITKVRSAIRREKTRINMNRMSDEDINSAIQTGHISYNKAVVQCSNILKREINWKKISVNEWYYIQVEIDRMLTDMKKRNRNAETYSA